MTRPLSRAGAVLVAGLIAFGVLAGCGSVDVSVQREPAATTSAAGVPPTTQAASTPATMSPGGTGSDPAVEPDATTAAAATETRAEILQLEGALLDGQQFDFAATAGNDVLLWFWAPW